MKNPVPLKYRLYRKYNGAVPQPVDSRDIVLGDVPYVPDPNCPGWSVGFDNEVKYGKLKREHQGPSLSCVGQGWSKYLEMINLIEEGHIDDLSAKDVYSQIYLTDGGAYIREGAKIAVNVGVSEESYLVSYEYGEPPTEPFMRCRDDILEGYEENRAIYKCKKFVLLPTSFPLNTEDWENIRQVIWQFGGFVSGYNRHCMYASAYYLKNGKKTIKFVNSYGEGSDREYSEGDAYPLYDITFLYDMPNPPKKIDMLKVIKTQNKKDQAIIAKDGAYIIPDVETRDFLVRIGVIVPEIQIVTENEWNKVVGLNPKRFPSKKLMDVLELVVKDIYLAE